jgi:hypothetical protein
MDIHCWYRRKVERLPRGPSGVTLACYPAENRHPAPSVAILQNSRICSETDFKCLYPENGSHSSPADPVGYLHS